MISEDFSSSHSHSHMHSHSNSNSKSHSHSHSHRHRHSNSHSYSINSGPRMILGWLLQGSVISLLDLSHSRCWNLLFFSI